MSFEFCFAEKSARRAKMVVWSSLGSLIVNDLSNFARSPTAKKKKLAEWRIHFYLCAGMCVRCIGSAAQQAKLTKRGRVQWSESWGQTGANFL